MKILSSFMYPHDISNDILSSVDTKENILKNVFLLVPIDFHCMDKNTMEVNGNQKCLAIDILQNILFHVWNDINGGRIFIFGWIIISLKHI